jgi:hypothetical protein
MNINKIGVLSDPSIASARGNSQQEDRGCTNKAIWFPLLHSTLGLSGILLGGVILVNSEGVSVAANIPISANIAGVGNVQIGSLTSTVNNGATPFESGLFQLNMTYTSLMNNMAGQQFRYVQVITQDDEPAKYPNGTVVTVPYVDPVSGGYDYQVNAGNKPGADTVPFYENNDGVNYTPNGWYDYSDTYANAGIAKAAGFGGKPVHSDANGNVSTIDAPGLSTKGDTTSFTTYITYFDNTLGAAKEFDVLGGFTWTATDPAGTVTYNGGASVGAITSALLLQLDVAMYDSGFNSLAGGVGPPGPNDWTAITGYAVPEPTTLALAGLSGLVSLFVLRRKQK